MSTIVRFTYAEWVAEGKRRFGDNIRAWRFVCPLCGTVASMAEWIEAGATNSAGFSCIERFRSNGQCDYVGGGLFKLNPVRVTTEDGECSCFAFAEVDKGET